MLFISVLVSLGLERWLLWFMVMVVWFCLVVSELRVWLIWWMILVVSDLFMML